MRVSNMTQQNVLFAELREYGLDRAHIPRVRFLKTFWDFASASALVALSEEYHVHVPLKR
jgi:hypothetical protein